MAGRCGKTSRRVRVASGTQRHVPARVRICVRSPDASELISGVLAIPAGAVRVVVDVVLCGAGIEY
jgi:hypothetical protein